MVGVYIDIAGCRNGRGPIGPAIAAHRDLHCSALGGGPHTYQLKLNPGATVRRCEAILGCGDISPPMSAYAARIGPVTGPMLFSTTARVAHRRFREVALGPSDK
jgi:hypothetical protein